MLLLIIATSSGFISAFIGFGIGRLGDKYGGHLKTPHHWIYGFILMILGLVYFTYFIGLWMLLFGLGHFISDLDDFLHFRIISPDAPHKWRFWSIK